MIPYTAPRHGSDGFNCPHCNAFAEQTWSILTTNLNRAVPGLEVANCRRCPDFSLWYKERMIYPAMITAPLPNPDLPQDVKDDYEEARSINSQSPRGAAALLRLAIQKLVRVLDGDGTDLNAAIAKLVEQGLSPKVQKALDVVRVIGNNAVHPGQIDVKDDPETVESLFRLLNIIAETMISQPGEIDQLYTSLPEEQRQAIERRDAG